MRTASIPFLIPLLLQGPVSWRFSATERTVDQVEVRLEAVCEPGWHIYALARPRADGPLPTEIRLEDGTGFRPMGPVVEPVPEEVEDPNFGMLVRYHADTVPFSLLLQRTSPEPFIVKGEVEFMVCNDKTCLPPTVVPFTVQVPASH